MNLARLLDLLSEPRSTGAELGRVRRGSGFGFWISGFGFRVSGSWFRVPSFGCQVSSVKSLRAEKRTQGGYESGSNFGVREAGIWRRP